MSWKTILITFNHIERTERATSKEELQNKLLRAMNELKLQTSWIVISEEPHRAGGAHYHALIVHEGMTRAQSRTICISFRKAFPEFTGRSINVQFKKGEGAALLYVIKWDKHYLTWNIERDEIERRARTSESKSKLFAKEVFERIEQSRTWEDFARDPQNQILLLRNLSNIQKVFAEHKRVQSMHCPTLALDELRRMNLTSKVTNFVYIDARNAHFGSNEHLILLKKSDFIGQFSDSEMYIILHLLFRFFDISNPLDRKKQLLIVGPTSVGKTYLINSIIDCLRLKVARVHGNDWSRTERTPDIIILDEFDMSRHDQSMLLKILGGEEFLAEGKYLPAYTSQFSQPILLLTNYDRLPDYEGKESLYSRLTIVHIDRFNKKDSFSTNEGKNKLLAILQDLTQKIGPKGANYKHMIDQLDLSNVHEEVTKELIERIKESKK